MKHVPRHCLPAGAERPRQLSCVFSSCRGRSCNKYFPLFSSVLRYDYGHYLDSDSDHPLFFDAQSKFHEKLIILRKRCSVGH